MESQVSAVHVANGNHHDADYDGFLARVQARFLSNIAGGSEPLFTTDAEDLWALYLGTFASQARPNSSGVEVKHQPSGTVVPHQASAPSHLKPGGQVFTTHRNTPYKATYIGPDKAAGPNHHEIKVGNSRVSVPASDLHPTREVAHKYNGG